MESRYDDWFEEPELKRIAGKIGSLDNLNALLVCTCSLFDDGKTEYYHKSLWDRIFQLYYDLKEEME